MKKEHEYSQLLRWIADGEVIEMDSSMPKCGFWVLQSHKNIIGAMYNGLCSPSRYRIKPKTIRIGAFDVPEPMRVAPSHGDAYWEVSTDGVSRDTWRSDFAQISAFHKGLLQSTREGAEAAYVALLSLTKAPA